MTSDEVTVTVFDFDLCPDVTDKSDFLTPMSLARYLTNSALASPSTGGAEILTLTASGSMEVTPLDEAPGTAFGTC